MVTIKVCPVCGKIEDSQKRPFCSQRCKDIDLAKWFSEDYRVLADEKYDTNEEQND